MKGIAKQFSVDDAFKDYKFKIDPLITHSYR
jgi:hypothetical protein